MDAKIRYWSAWCRQQRQKSRATINLGLWCPQQWHPQSSFSPLKSRLLNDVLSTRWYSLLYGIHHNLLLLPNEMQEWKMNELARATIRENIRYILKHFRIKISTLGWLKLFESAYAFDLQEEFAQLCISAEPSFVQQPTLQAIVSTCIY